MKNVNQNIVLGIAGAFILSGFAAFVFGHQEMGGLLVLIGSITCLGSLLAVLLNSLKNPDDE